MRLTVFKYGTTDITAKMAFVGGDEKVKLSISLLFFLIEHEDRKILIDVGCDNMPGFELHQFELPVNVLEQYKISRSEITDVILTHAHHDHIHAVYNYPEAVVYIHKDELANARKYLENSKKISVFDEDFEIIDNVCVKVIGGHSKGSSVVLVKSNEKEYVLCGDECYTKENFANKIPTGSSISPEKSRKFVEEYGKEKYIPIIFHDPDIVPEIGFKVLY